MSTLKQGAHIHLIGICGTAMASLAGILKDLGYKVTGSDQNVYPPMSTQLEKLGIPIQLGFKKENLNPRPDLVIVGNVVSRSNPEVEALLASDIAYTSLPKAMGEYAIGTRESFVIAGTHGKTTTTSLMAWITDSVGLRAGFLIGGIPLNYGQSFRAPQGNAFVIEGDEYDTAFFDKVPKFIHYRPKHVILTSVEFDHADIYKDLEHVKSAFKQLLQLIPEDGTLVYHADDENIVSLLPFCKAKRQIGYGSKNGDYRMTEREVMQGRNQFTVLKGQTRVADLALKIFGEHNSLNALAVFALADALNWPHSKILQAFADFKGVKRRQEHLGDIKGITVFEDFAHHPTAVDLTLRCMHERYPGRRVIGVFEPRSATSRRKVFQDEYAKAFAQADVVFIAQPFDQSKIDAGDRFSTDQLISELRGKGKVAETAPDVPGLLSQLSKTAKSGDVILIMSNGGFDGIYQKLLQQLGE
ncbi:MAG: UDP-N-acetylmuramate:L-alanyl-gamma-D-glutamyl-meso-diaminopimelate ligase [Bdellovibrionales bacterium]|nr:UDP-N-acetylmuramate:L-alanyl-gamma-D-glutamyl-meso-diaminopimelate ligase [Bdellovibrionales bacterium]